MKAAREFYDDAVGRFGLSDKVTLEGLWEDFLKNWNITDDDVTESSKGMLS